MDVTVSEIPIPASLDGPDADDFRAATRLSRDVLVATMGSDELSFAVDEVHPKWLDPHVPKHLLVARVDDAIVGRGVYETIDDADAPEGWLVLEVLPAFRRRGIGSTLLNAIRGMARAEGRTSLQGYQLVASGWNTETLAAPTGFGGLPLAEAGTAFALSSGFTLEQVERVSRLPLPLDTASLRARLEAAGAASGPDYRPVLWEGATPEQWLDDVAVLAARIVREAPFAGLDMTEEKWDAARVRDEDERESTSPRIRLTAAALHVPSGRLVGYSQLSLPPAHDRSVDQGNTIVLTEHRGHRLGMLIKLANLLALQEGHAGYPSVTTYNAEENRHMLSVNEDLGFVPIGYEGAWRQAL
jgi:GNAT superfamily N-acetyltransferase